ncbi:MAG: RidA family protein [Pseudomonadota bacterium]
MSDARERSDAVSYNGMAYVVAYDPTGADGISAQTRNCLRFLDEKLAQVGSGKEALLQATVFLSDMSMKAEMDEVWREWIGSSENWPQRACVGADLGDDATLIEITAIAAQFESQE